MDFVYFLVDANPIAIGTPRQRNTREENEKLVVSKVELIKNGEGDDLWNDHPHKKCHKAMQ